MISENLRSEIEANPLLEIDGDARPLEFDRGGNLVEMLKGVGEQVAVH